MDSPVLELHDSPAESLSADDLATELMEAMTEALAEGDPEGQPGQPDPQGSTTVDAGTNTAAKPNHPEKEPHQTPDTQGPGTPGEVATTQCPSPTSTTVREKTFSTPDKGGREPTQREEPSEQEPLFLPVERGLCWRCGYPGHSRDTCIAKPIKFCSSCGRVGILSRECRCTKSGKSRSAPRPQSSRHLSHPSPFLAHAARHGSCPTCGCPFASVRPSRAAEARRPTH